ncbi:hypothetical protein J8L85_15865 [Maribacter sp. MMG018]|uniref:hypothetical protein n=1 Tax=Maribacter sp. MMG018 TaxID=2822688 RepID=UPI001B37FA83|nr:hypothetical protein [Maribacter sp. MMG018]MBQ4915932.1 hypothetical protein [Maribacter sp. MMG018]
MMNSENTGIALYENLGKLFYAVASIDGNVHTKEIEHLRSFIRSYWLDIDEIEDEFGTDAAFMIETAFDWLFANETDPKESYNEFVEFYEEHKEKFTPEIKRLVMDTGNAMANAFAGKNKSELILLAKIEILFR